MPEVSTRAGGIDMGASRSELKKPQIIDIEDFEDVFFITTTEDDLDD